LTVVKLLKLLAWSWSFYGFALVFRMFGWPATDKQMSMLIYVCSFWSFCSVALFIFKWRSDKKHQRP
jgi:hypothetical protein